MNDGPAIELLGVTKIFRRRRRLARPFQKVPDIHALERIDLRVAAGETISILGSNGSGKTTLVRIMAGVLLPSAGSVRRDAGRRDAGRLIHVSAAERQFQERLTGYENLRFFARLSGRPVTEIRPACRAVGLEEEVIDQQVWTYTTGMKVRLAMARAFMGPSRLVLLDEPTRSMDLTGRADLRRAILALRERHGTTVVVAGHDLETAAACDRAVLLSRGAIRWSGAGRDEASLRQECGRIARGEEK